MLNACQVKLNIGIELYRTTKHENAWRVVLSMRRYRVSKEKKKAKITQRRVIARVRRISIYSVIFISSLLNKWYFVNKRVKP